MSGQGGFGCPPSHFGMYGMYLNPHEGSGWYLMLSEARGAIYELCRPASMASDASDKQPATELSNWFHDVHFVLLDLSYEMLMNTCYCLGFLRCHVAEYCSLFGALSSPKARQRFQIVVF